MSKKKQETRATKMSNHPPTESCSDQRDREEKPRVLLMNPEGNSVVFSTDQTAKGRPEWIFPKLPAEQELMVSCSIVISDHDRRSALPDDMEVIHFDPFQNGRKQALIARVLSKNEDDAVLKEGFERYFFHKQCDHGVIVVIPVAQAARAQLGVMSRDDLRKNVDTTMVTLLEKEMRNVDRVAAMLLGRR